MTRCVRIAGMVLLPSLVVLVGGEPATASDKPIVLAQNSDHNSSNVPTKPPEGNQNDQPSAPPGGSQDEPGGVEASVDPENTNSKLPTAKPPALKHLFGARIQNH